MHMYGSVLPHLHRLRIICILSDLLKRCMCCWCLKMCKDHFLDHPKTVFSPYPRWCWHLQRLASSLWRMRFLLRELILSGKASPELLCALCPVTFWILYKTFLVWWCNLTCTWTCFPREKNSPSSQMFRVPSCILLMKCLLVSSAAVRFVLLLWLYWLVVEPFVILVSLSVTCADNPVWADMLVLACI